MLFRSVYDPSLTGSAQLANSQWPKANSPQSPSYNPFRQKPSSDWQRLYEGLPSSEEKAQPAPSLFEPEQTSADNPSLISHLSSLNSDISPLHYQYKGRYVMTAVKSGLMVIDQHRADVRIRYERYMHQLADAPSQTQRLLFPVFHFVQAVASTAASTRRRISTCVSSTLMPSVVRWK